VRAKHWRTWHSAKRWCTGVLGLVILFMAWLYSYSGPIAMQRLQYSPYLLDNQGELMHVLLAKDERYRFQTTKSDVDGHYLNLLLAYEDQRFYQHHGIDWWAMIRALSQLLNKGYVVSGGSTLTMQTIRLLEPKSRTLWHKIDQMRKAIALERRYTKDEILAFYLSLAPFGSNIESVQMASRVWFGKWAKDLTPAEAALLVALPQSPERRRPDRFLQAAVNARNRVLERALSKGVISKQYLSTAGLSNIPTRWHKLPKLAPHLLWKRTLQNNTTAKTTLNSHWQARISTIAKATTLTKDINMAILLVESKTGNVLSYIGSQKYLDFANYGAVNYVDAVRSPGSTLKPFIYALAESESYIHFNTLINDSVTQIGGYQPLNMSKKNYGEVTISEALQRSLNIPAVKVLHRYGPAKFKAKLAQIGVPLRKGSGLPIALGGAGVTLWELVKLYNSLANEGNILPLKTAPNEISALPGKQLLTQSSTAQINWILSHNLGGKNRLHGAYKTQDLVYKTGTGPGGSDAIAIGTNGKYTVGVWIGSHDGSHQTGNTGYQTAVPVLNRVFDQLPKGKIKVLQPKKPPTALTRFDQHDGKLKVQYPIEGSIIARKNNAARVPVVFKTVSYPVVVKINNNQLIMLYRASDFIEFDKPGGYTLSFVDGQGNSANLALFVE